MVWHTYIFLKDICSIRKGHLNPSPIKKKNPCCFRQYGLCGHLCLSFAIFLGSSAFSIWKDIKSLHTLLEIGLKAFSVLLHITLSLTLYTSVLLILYCYSREKWVHFRWVCRTQSPMWEKSCKRECSDSQFSHAVVSLGGLSNERWKVYWGILKLQLLLPLATPLPQLACGKICPNQAKHHVTRAALVSGACFCRQHSCAFHLAALLCITFTGPLYHAHPVVPR